MVGMKQSYLIAFGALLLAACGAEQAEEAESVRVSALPRPEQPAGNGFSSPGEGIAIVNGSQAASIDISLPANLDELDEALAKTLRERVNAGQAGFLEAAQNDRRAAENGDYDFKPHSLTVSWEQVGPEDGMLRSFLGVFAAYTGGAHPNYTFEVLNWDSKKGTEVGFADLFADPEEARQIMRASLQPKLMEAKRERLNGFDASDEQILDTWVRPAFEENASVYENFTVAPGGSDDLAGGMIYHFAPYMVGSYAEGAYEIGVPASVFEAELKPRYREAFDGDVTELTPPPAP
ncbi:MAG: hypothetical protein CME94_06590 [Hyphomonadaceae bacterium]|nr:hypothetical protein [Hyphomonadaceae bacterium]PHR79757.1 MAG: hypothetical protein COA64_05150 [Henriciella sp.]